MDEKVVSRLCLSCGTQIKLGQEYETIIGKGQPTYRHIDYQDCSDHLSMAWHFNPNASHGMISC